MPPLGMPALITPLASKAISIMLDRIEYAGDHPVGVGHEVAHVGLHEGRAVVEVEPAVPARSVSANRSRMSMPIHRVEERVQAAYVGRDDRVDGRDRWGWSSSMGMAVALRTDTLPARVFQLQLAQVARIGAGLHDDGAPGSGDDGRVVEVVAVPAHDHVDAADEVGQVRLLVGPGMGEGDHHVAAVPCAGY